MIVPHDALQPDTLAALIEEFITRDGAIHGHRETPPEQMAAQVKKQLERGTALIVYDEESESCSILTKEEATARPPDTQTVHEEDYPVIRHDEFDQIHPEDS